MPERPKPSWPKGGSRFENRAHPNPHHPRVKSRHPRRRRSRRPHGNQLHRMAHQKRPETKRNHPIRGGFFSFRLPPNRRQIIKNRPPRHIQLRRHLIAADPIHIVEVKHLPLPAAQPRILPHRLKLRTGVMIPRTQGSIIPSLPSTAASSSRFTGRSGALPSRTPPAAALAQWPSSWLHAGSGSVAA